MDLSFKQPIYFRDEEAAEKLAGGAKKLNAGAKARANLND